MSRDAGRLLDSQATVPGLTVHFLPSFSLNTTVGPVPVNNDWWYIVWEHNGKITNATSTDLRCDLTNEVSLPLVKTLFV